MLRLDPETVLILLTTTRIPGRFYRTGTVVGPCSVDDLRSCAVTSTVTTEPFFPVLDIIGTEDKKQFFLILIEVCSVVGTMLKSSSRWGLYDRSGGVSLHYSKATGWNAPSCSKMADWTASSVAAPRRR